MKLKLDENLGRSVAELLRAAGHDVATVREQGLSSADDRTLIAVCRDERRCLVTMDMDFANTLVFKPSEYSGIVVLRLPRRPAPSDLLDASRTLLGALSQYSVEGKLWIVQRGRLREYSPSDDPGR